MCELTNHFSTLREARGCSGPRRLQWKAAKSSSGRMWLPVCFFWRATFRTKQCSWRIKSHVQNLSFAYQEEQQKWAGAVSWGRAGEPPLIAGTGEWSDSCHSRRAWERESWNRPERCIAQTLSPVRSDPENHSLCTGIAPPDDGPPGSAPPTTQVGWKVIMCSCDLLSNKLQLIWSDNTAFVDNNRGFIWTQCCFNTHFLNIFNTLTSPALPRSPWHKVVF